MKGNYQFSTEREVKKAGLNGASITLCLPKHLVEVMGIKDKDKVRLIYGPKEMVLRK